MAEAAAAEHQVISAGSDVGGRPAEDVGLDERDVDAERVRTLTPPGEGLSRQVQRIDPVPPFGEPHGVAPRAAPELVEEPVEQRHDVVDGRRVTHTPTRQSAPPSRASTGGASPRNAHPRRIATGGTRYVVAPSRPAFVRASA
ncbi:hypothetical protein GALL_358760 [mine drainage metagenome]|uniref:Uncharacterized protein n=1 Tax=mine drainage metagenome TaxID=410659 RepID=A0A1J5QR21_9ZZZZ